jgi:hypothetical protein
MEKERQPISKGRDPEGPRKTTCHSGLTKMFHVKHLSPIGAQNFTRPKTEEVPPVVRLISLLVFLPGALRQRLVVLNSGKVLIGPKRF